MFGLSSRRLYVGTDDGLRTIDVDGGSATLVGTALDGEAVRDVSAHPSDPDDALIACGLRGWGLHRTVDGGRTTESLGFEDVHVWGVDRHPCDPDEVYVGTEPPGLYRRSEPTASFVELDGIHDVPSRDEWSFFYEPFEAGHVHGLSAHPDRPDRLFAGVEIGGVLRSEDRGVTWSDALAGADVHRTTVHPDDADRVFAATATGVLESDDGGATWDAIAATDGYYCKAVRFGRDGTGYITGAERPTAEDAIVWAEDDGTWVERARLPADGVAGKVSFAPVADALVHAVAVDEGAGAERNRIAVSRDGGLSWNRIGPAVPTVRAIDHVALD